MSETNPHEELPPLLTEQLQAMSAAHMVLNTMATIVGSDKPIVSRTNTPGRYEPQSSRYGQTAYVIAGEEGMTVGMLCDLSPPHPATIHPLIDRFDRSLPEEYLSLPAVKRGSVVVNPWNSPDIYTWYDIYQIEHPAPIMRDKAIVVEHTDTDAPDFMPVSEDLKQLLERRVAELEGIDPNDPDLPPLFAEIAGEPVIWSEGYRRIDGPKLLPPEDVQALASLVVGAQFAGRQIDVSSPDDYMS